MNIRIIAMALALSVISLFNTSLLAHGVAKTVMYPADKVYREKGLKVPDLGKDLIAIIGDRKVTKKEYKKWLRAKIGFKPENRETFLVSQYLGSVLNGKGIDVEERGKLFFRHIYKMISLDNVYMKVEDWELASKEFEEQKAELNDRDRENMRIQYNNHFLNALYLIANWGEVFESRLKENGVKENSISIKNEDGKVDPILQLNNAYYLARRFMTYLTPDIKRQAYAKGFKALVSEEEYVDWIYQSLQSPLYTENFIAMYLVERKAKMLGVEVSEVEVNELFKSRKEGHRNIIEQYNKGLVPFNGKMSLDPEYYKSLLHECRVDLLGSRQFRQRNPIPDYDVVKKFYEEYGYKGERCNVYEIFKWVRKRVQRKVSNEYIQYAESQGKRVEADLKALREQINAEGVKDFPVIAIVENDVFSLANACGYMDNPASSLGTEHTKALKDLNLNQISGILKTPANTLNIVWFGEDGPAGKKYFTIAKKLPNRSAFNLESYKKEMKLDRGELERLKREIESGAKIEKLAEEHSDSFRKSGYDISEKYQRLYGYKFSHKLSEMKEGELNVLDSDKGLHLVQLNKKTVTPFTDEIKDQIVNEYNTELATNDELNELSKELLFEFHPYF